MLGYVFNSRMWTLCGYINSHEDNDNGSPVSCKWYGAKRASLRRVQAESKSVQATDIKVITRVVRRLERDLSR